MKLKILNEILIIDILSVLLILSIAFIPSTAPRVILGLPFLLFFPGYTLVTALFVKKSGMNNIERLALSIGMSIAVVALLGFGLNYTTWGIRLEPVLYATFAFICVMSAITLIRRARILKINKFTTEFTLSLPGWGGSTFNKSLSIILVIAIFGALGTLVYTTLEPKIGEIFTEFYIQGKNGKAQDYPTTFTIESGSVTQVTYGDGTIDTSSGFGKVTLGIVNHEQQTVVYSVKMTIDSEPVDINFNGTETAVLGPIELQQSEKWENQLEFAPHHSGDNQKVELFLFKGVETTAENSLHLWINVDPGNP